jgi:hypothetical protein
MTTTGDKPGASPAEAIETNGVETRTTEPVVIAAANINAPASGSERTEATASADATGGETKGNRARGVARKGGGTKVVEAVGIEAKRFEASTIVQSAAETPRAEPRREIPRFAPQKIEGVAILQPEPVEAPRAAPRPQARPAPAGFAQAARRVAEPRVVAVAAAALALGTVLGFGAASVPGSHDQGSAAAVASLAAAIDSGRTDTAKLSASLARIDQTLGEVKATAEAARKESTSKGVTERITQLERTLTTKLVSLGERIEQAEREQAGRVAALSSRAAAKVEVAKAEVVKPDAVKADGAKADPAQTGSIAEPKDTKDVKAAEAKAAEAKRAEWAKVEAAKADAAKAEAAKVEAAKAAAQAKPAVLEQFALRDIFEGAAIVENRVRRLFQVMPGDTLPGAGRVEAIERRGRTWVVVTRQGVVTPQAW